MNEMPSEQVATTAPIRTRFSIHSRPPTLQVTLRCPIFTNAYALYIANRFLPFKKHKNMLRIVTDGRSWLSIKKGNDFMNGEGVKGLETTAISRQVQRGFFSLNSWALIIFSLLVLSQSRAFF